MSHPKLRLRYFPFPGRGGAIRDALNIGGIPFEDAHVALDQFPQRKAADEFPFGALPVLDVETPAGTVTSAQSNAILRYVGRLVGLYPVDDPLRALKVDEAMDFAEEFFRLVGPSMTEQDMDKRMAMRKVLAEDGLPCWAGYLEKLLVANGRTGFVVGDALTVADLKLHWVVDKLTNGTLDGIPTSIANPFPALKAWQKNVAEVRAKRLAAR
jgi:glutathione S-transferase